EKPAKHRPVAVRPLARLPVLQIFRNRTYQFPPLMRKQFPWECQSVMRSTKNSRSRLETKRCRPPIALEKILRRNWAAANAELTCPNVYLKSSPTRASRALAKPPKG